jgi:hypothetical protein
MRLEGLTAVMLGALMLGGCGLGPDPTPDYRYRLMVEVDAPEGL